jgi:hypothetical protein
MIAINAMVHRRKTVPIKENTMPITDLIQTAVQNAIPTTSVQLLKETVLLTRPVPEDR